MISSGDIIGRKRGQLPLVKLSLAFPLIVELDRRGVDADSVLDAHDLSREMLTASDLFVPATVIYRLAEAAAKAADDPFIGVTAGAALDLFSWPPFVSAGSKPGTIGDFILNFTTNANSLASSVEVQLHTNGDYTTFRSYRVFEPATRPAQIDGFFVGMFVNILDHAVGDLWDTAHVVLSVCDPRVIPTGYHGIAVVSQGDNRGPSIQFPTRWLVESVNPETSRKLNKPPHTSLRAALREAVGSYLHVPDLNSDRVAKICGYSTRSLARKLAAEGTTISKEIAELKKQSAVKALIESNRSIADIADSLGFATPSMFSRSFKRWTGRSPRDYRRENRRN